MWYEIGCMDGLSAADEEPNLENLWHDAGEEPRRNELLLGEDTDGFSIYRWCGQEDNWEAFVNETGLSRWAYIKDLLPKGGKKWKGLNEKNNKPHIWRDCFNNRLHRNNLS